MTHIVSFRDETCVTSDLFSALGNLDGRKCLCSHRQAVGGVGMAVAGWEGSPKHGARWSYGLWCHVCLATDATIAQSLAVYRELTQLQPTLRYAKLSWRNGGARRTEHGWQESGSGEARGGEGVALGMAVMCWTNCRGVWLSFSLEWNHLKLDRILRHHYIKIERSSWNLWAYFSVI